MADTWRPIEKGEGIQIGFLNRAFDIKLNVNLFDDDFLNGGCEKKSVK